MKPGAGQGSPLRVAPCPVQSDTGQNYYIAWDAELPYLSNAASRRVPSRWAGGRDGMDGRANTDALNAALRGCSKTHRQEAAGGGRQWLGGDQGLGGWRGRGGRSSWTSSSVVYVPVIMQDNFQQFCAPDSVHRQWLDIPAQRRVPTVQTVS